MKWYDYYGADETDFVGSVERILEDLLYGEGGRFKIVDTYPGDHKECPSVTIRFSPSGSESAKDVAEYWYDSMLGMEKNPYWGWFTVLAGDEIYLASC
jgi:hypothetical protein